MPSILALLSRGAGLHGYAPSHADQLRASGGADSRRAGGGLGRHLGHAVGRGIAAMAGAARLRPLSRPPARDDVVPHEDHHAPSRAFIDRSYRRGDGAASIPGRRPRPACRCQTAACIGWRMTPVSALGRHYQCGPALLLEEESGSSSLAGRRSRHLAGADDRRRSRMARGDLSALSSSVGGSSWTSLAALLSVRGRVSLFAARLQGTAVVSPACRDRHVASVGRRFAPISGKLRQRLGAFGSVTSSQSVIGTRS